MRYIASKYNKQILYFLLFMIPVMIILLLSTWPQKKIIRNAFEVRNSLTYNIGSETPFTGMVLDTITTKIIEYYLVDGLKQGNFIVYNFSGNVEVFGKMVNNKNEGEWKYFFPDGKIESVGNFENDKLTGKWVWYYPDGSLKKIGYFHKGQENGKWVEYKKSGEIKQETYFLNGKVVNSVKQEELKFS